MSNRMLRSRALAALLTAISVATSACVAHQHLESAAAPAATTPAGSTVTPSASTTAGAQTMDRRSKEEACAHPTGPIKERGYLHSNVTVPPRPTPSPVLAGVTQPPMSIYIGGGPPGTGLLCQTGSRDVPLIAATEPSSRPVAYFSVQLGGVGAVRPGVVKVVLNTGAGLTEVFGLTKPDSTDQTLWDLGDGWHGFASEILHTGGEPTGATAPVTATAFDANGTVVDRRTLDMRTVG